MNDTQRSCMKRIFLEKFKPALVTYTEAVYQLSRHLSTDVGFWKSRVVAEG